jgi:hypothetical protein
VRGAHDPRDGGAGRGTGSPGRARRQEGLWVRLELPLAFSDPTPTCPAGIAHVGISFVGQNRSGESCIRDVSPADCPSGVDALVCQTVAVLSKLRLPCESMQIDGNLFAVYTCGDPSCATSAVDQR